MKIWTYTMSIISVLLAACTGESPAEDPGAAAGAVEAEPTLSSFAATPPDTTARSVWAILQESDYPARWSVWPGRGELYSGGEPHGMLLTTYLNDVAAGALEAQLGAMPRGAILVKENYTPDSVLAAVTVMVKQNPGYNPAHNDWWFMKRNADGSVDAAGRGEGCQNCHQDAAANDYVFTGSLAGQGGG